MTRLLGDRPGNVLETHVGAGGASMGIVLGGNNLVGCEILENQLDAAKTNILQVPNFVQQMYTWRFQLPMCAMLIHKTQKAPYDPESSKNMYLPMPVLFEPEMWAKTAEQKKVWRSIFQGATSLTVSIENMCE